MQLTTRSKVLIGLAVLVTGYVLFGPGDAPPAEPAKGAHQKRAQLPGHVVAAPAGALQSLAALAHRVTGSRAADALFASHSWYVAPPPPPAAIKTRPVAPPKPVAPPLPFSYMGSYAPQGAPAVFFLTRGDRVYDVHVGDTLDDTYYVSAFANGVLTLTYKPLNEQQQLITEGTP